MINLKKTLVTTAVVIGVFFVLAATGFFVFRTMLLRKALDKVTTKLEQQYKSSFQYGDAYFTGLSAVELTDVTLVPENADTLLNIGKVNASVNFWYALLGDIRLRNLEMSEGFVNLVKDGNGRNFDHFLRGSASDSVSAEQKETTRSAYGKKIYRLLARVLNTVPTHMSLQNLSLRMNDMGTEVTIHLQTLSLADKQLQSVIDVNTKTISQHWNIKGMADPRGRKSDLELFNMDTGKILIPYIDERFNIISGFDSVRINLQSMEMDGSELKIRGFVSVSNFLVNHPKIAKKDVVIEKARFDYRTVIGDDYVSLDSASSFRFNKITCTPFISFSRTPDTLYQMSVKIGKMLAQDFITSLPEGLFTHFKGMEAMGSFEYRLDFVYNENKPQNLIFESTLTKDGLQIVKYGEANLGKLNGDFVYTPVEYGRPQRSILVSASNPNYTPLDQISPYLRKCVLTTEDPSFFYHRGFIDEAFRQSIIKNIRTRKFSRGASTISMQLVKNVFLTREKTISRKLEEILLVYILENNRISSKDRMLEVYFNIIEWGPNVYGIGEASRFYFQKHPSDLTLNECLFLATIIPRPKGFMWRFGKDGNLKEFAGRQFGFLTNLMLRREVLVPEDTLTRSVPLIITGPAKGFIRLSADTLATDSIILDENGRVNAVE
jgi:hypothetical protein